MLGKLTKRESEIAVVVAEGKSNKEIARILNITEGTVKIHLHSIFQKLGIMNRMVLMAKIIREEVMGITGEETLNEGK
jgi:two-component system nitrate/nitrite response regulator NarL